MLSEYGFRNGAFCFCLWDLEKDDFQKSAVVISSMLACIRTKDQAILGSL